MGEINPRLLAVILEDLQQELARWAIAAGDTLNAASFEQRHANERVYQIQHRARIVEARAADESRVVTETQSQVEALLSQCLESEKTSQQTLQTASAALRESRVVLAHWQAELQLALAWLARAEERVRRAEIELANAQRELSSAEYELSAARSALSNCQNSYTVDNDGNRHYRDCSGQRARVSMAQAAVAAAQARVYAAQVELAAARAELARAQARVRCCERAVEYATAAVGLAEEAVERAHMAIAAAERSLESVRAADKTMEQTADAARLAEEAAQQMLSDAHLASNHASEGQWHWNNAERAEEAARRLQILVRSELDYRLAQLYELNRPDLHTYRL